jgi:hypothetical protein
MRLRPLFPPPKEIATGKNLRNKGPQEYSVLTVNGRVYLKRIRWHGATVGSLTIIDAYLDRAEQTISVGVREMACRLNGNSSNFEKTAANLWRAAQVQASGETLRDLIESEGRKVLQAQQHHKLLLSWSAVDCHADPQDPTSTTRLYLGSDGVKVPLVTDDEKRKRRQKLKEKRRRRGKKCRPLPRPSKGADQRYKEFKIVAFYDETQEHRLVAGTKGDHLEAGRLMRRLAGAVHLDEAAEKVGNVDGAPWIRNQMERQSLPLDALGLDFYHLAENVHKARRVVYGEDDEAGKTWAGELLHAFKHEGYEAAWERLLTWRSAQRGGKRAAADTLLNYVSDRRDMIAYPEFQEKGWQIGSGPTEATCKTLTARLKGSGMRWEARNAEALMALEALSQSGMWKVYWQSLLPQAA